MVLLTTSTVVGDPVLDVTVVGVALHPYTPVAAPPAPPGVGRFDALKARLKWPPEFGVPREAAKEALDLIAVLGASDAGDDADTVEALRDLYSQASTGGGTPLAAWLAMVVEAGEVALAASAPSKASTASAVIHETRVGRLVDALRKPPSVPPTGSRYLRRDISAIYSTQSGAVADLLEVMVPPARGLLGPALANTAELPPLEVSFERLKVKAALFGHQAHSFPVYDEGTVVGFIDPVTTPLRSAGRVTKATVPRLVPTFAPTEEILLDAVYEGIRPGASVVLVNPRLDPKVVSLGVEVAEQVSATVFGVSGRVTKLTLTEPWPAKTASLADVLRHTQVLADPARVALGRVSIDHEDVADDVVELAGLHLDIGPGRFVTVSGERADPAIRAVQGSSGRPATGVAGVELAMVASVEHRAAHLPGGTALPGDTVHTFLRLAEPLAYRYRRPTVVVNANVVRATHGAGSGEVLGAGDATKAFQAFALKQPPLTYLPVPTPTGARSALEVRVNDVAWHEAEDLLGAGPDDHRFVVRTDDDGQTAVVFGDGERGARLPTGIENVRAFYRTGLGRAGNVGAGQIRIAVDRPLGVKDVVNPLAATGGADRETRDQARRNAPVAIQALDRLVSVPDYADFARAFAGVGSATSAELSDGRRLLVHVTIAGVDDAPIAVSSDLYRNLLRALVDLGDPFQPLELAIRELRVLVIEAGVRVDPDHRWDTVEPALRAALVDRLGAHRRQLAQDVVQAEVLATMQAVPGVTFVQLRILDAVGEADLSFPNVASKLGLRARIAARPDRRVKGRAGAPDTVAPAQLVVLSPAVPDTLVLSELL